MTGSLKSRVSMLYTDTAPRSVRFRYGLFVFDLCTVAYFIAVTPFAITPGIRAINALLALVILVDLLARFWIAEDRWQHLSRIYVIADIVVLLSLALQPFVHVDLTFLRILRGLRLGHSNYLLEDLRRDWRFFREHEDPIVAALNLVVFVFVTTAAVFTFFVEESRGVVGYIDALYYTVTTLTTTGYGDLTPTTPLGKLAAVAIMVIGVSLFVNLARAVVLPAKVYHPCERCGLTRHDPDSVHCKHCGATLRIETKGAA